MTKIVRRHGQSNTAGPRDISSELQGEYKTTFANIQVWNGTAFASLDYSVNNNQYPTTNDKFAFEFAMLKDLQIGWGETIYHIPYAESATNMADEWKTTGSTYRKARGAVYEAFAYLWNVLQVRDSWEIYTIFNQGEGDSSAEATANGYEALYRQCKDGMQAMMDGSAWTNAKKIFINPKVNKEIVNEGYAFAVTVHDAQQTVADEDANVHTLATESYELHNAVDDPHFSAAGMDDLGEAVAAYILNNNL